MPPTPDQQRKIVHARQSVDQYWYVDIKTKEIRRKAQKGWGRVLNLVWKTRHDVWAVYWWLRYKQAREDMMLLPNPINSDNMPIEGFPMKYELQGGWTIPRSDLRYLKGGPLAAEGLTGILVPAELGWQRVVQFFRQFGVVLSGVVAFAGTVIRYWQEVVSIIKWFVGVFA